jgi:hypothetical protein
MLHAQEKFLSRRDIVVDNITAMNPEELKELNAIAKANMLHREGRTRVRVRNPRLPRAPLSFITIAVLRKSFVVSDFT